MNKNLLVKVSCLELWIIEHVGVWWAVSLPCDEIYFIVFAAVSPPHAVCEVIIPSVNNLPVAVNPV